MLYLRDEEEKRRFKEEELRESERAQFLRLQAVAEPGPGNLKQMAAAPPQRGTATQAAKYASHPIMLYMLLCRLPRTAEH